MKRRPARRTFDLSRAMFILPNLFTVSSIFCGFYGVVTAAGAESGHDLYRACIAILFAMVFDAVDGRVARLTHTQSEFGVQMDSLADVISFGAAPALIAWHWGLMSFGTTGLLVCFAYTACGTIRLARFNVMAGQSDGPSNFFVGLPIPAAAGMLVAVIIASIRAEISLTGAEWWPLPLMVVLAVLMVSDVPFRTFKTARINKQLLASLGGVIALVVSVTLYGGASLAIAALLALYISTGVIESAFRLIRGDRADTLDPDEPNLLDEPDEELLD